MVAGRDRVRDQIIHNHIQRVFRDDPESSKVTSSLLLKPLVSSHAFL